MEKLKQSAFNFIGLQTDELCRHLEGCPCHGFMLLHHLLTLADRLMPNVLLSAQHHAGRNTQPAVNTAMTMKEQKLSELK